MWLKNGVKIVELKGIYYNYFSREGVKEGDIITAINNIKVNSVEDVKDIIKNRDKYQPLSIELVNSKGQTNRYGLR